MELLSVEIFANMLIDFKKRNEKKTKKTKKKTKKNYQPKKKQKKIQKDGKKIIIKSPDQFDWIDAKRV